METRVTHASKGNLYSREKTTRGDPAFEVIKADTRVDGDGFQSLGGTDDL